MDLRAAFASFRPPLAARPVRAAVLAALLAVAGALGAASPVETLGAGQFVWMPEIAPQGPVVVFVSLPTQRAYVYRNGVRIGAAAVSTGSAGRETPPGVYAILEKQRVHYSNLYDDAPMPFMQRLTWDGIALHAGRDPGYPASHGCIRLPPAFAEKLFGVTARGTTVVVSATEIPPGLTPPGLFATPAPPLGVPALTPWTPYTWMPDRAPEGPLTVLVGTREHRIVVLRNAVEIGRAEFALVGELPPGTRAYVMLEGVAPGPNPVLPDRPARRWMAMQLEGDDTQWGGLRDALADGRMRIPEAFAARVFEVLGPGATVVVTDEPLAPPAPASVLATDPAPDAAGNGP